MIESFKLMLRAFGPARSRLFLALGLMVASALLESMSGLLFLPILEVMSDANAASDRQSGALKAIISTLHSFGINDVFGALCAILIFTYFFKSFFSIASLSFNAATAERVRLHWLELLGQRYLFAPYAVIAAQRHGTIANNIIRETTEVSRFLNFYLTYLINFFMVCFLVGSMAIVDWRVVAVFGTLISLVVIPIRKLLFGTASRLGKESIRLSQSIIGYVYETASAQREIRLFGAERLRITGIRSIMAQLTRVFILTQIIKGLPQPVGEFIFITVGGGMLYALHIYTPDQLALVLPKIAFFALALVRLMAAQSQLVSIKVAYSNKAPSVHLVFELLEDPKLAAEQPDDNDKLPAPKFEGLTFDAVSFGYSDDRQVLHDVTASIPAGKTTYLLGSSGAGKSTILDMIGRFYSPTSGSIAMAGHDISDYDIKSWRNKLGYVSQEAVIFTGSLRDNIRLGRQHVTDREVEAAAELAGLLPLLGTRPEGLDTIVGDRGLELSGGQRKRIAIARALAGSPELLILDEATTSFEENLEQAIILAIRQALPGITILVVTHRINTAKHGDCVLVLDNGRIVANGAYDMVREQVESLLATIDPKELKASHAVFRNNASNADDTDK